MKLVSSKSTLFYKKILPLLWFIVIGFVSCLLLMSFVFNLATEQKAEFFPVLVAFVFWFVSYYFIKTELRLADKVFDDGSADRMSEIVTWNSLGDTDQHAFLDDVSNALGDHLIRS